MNVGDLAQVGVEDHGAVELDLDLRALDRHLLEVPLADGPEVAALGGDHAVGRAVGLPRVELGVLRGRVVEDLELAHARCRRCRPCRGSGSPGRCCRRGEPELDAGGEVAVLLVVVEHAALARLAADGAVDDLVVVHRIAGPAVEGLAVEDRREPFGAVAGEDRVGLVARGSRGRRCSASGSRRRGSGAGSASREERLLRALSQKFSMIA